MPGRCPPRQSARRAVRPFWPATSHGAMRGGKTGGNKRQAGNIVTEETHHMASSANPTRDDFAALLDETLGTAAQGGFEGRVVKGTVTAIENDKAVIDVGLKSEGRVALR